MQHHHRRTGTAGMGGSTGRGWNPAPLPCPYICPSRAPAMPPQPMAQTMAAWIAAQWMGAKPPRLSRVQRYIVRKQGCACVCLCVPVCVCVCVCLHTHASSRHIYLLSCMYLVLCTYIQFSTAICAICLRQAGLVPRLPASCCRKRGLGYLPPTQKGFLIP